MYRLAVTVPAEAVSDFHNKLLIETRRQAPSVEYIQDIANIYGEAVELYFVGNGMLYLSKDKTFDPRDSIFIPKDARPILCVQPNT